MADNIEKEELEALNQRVEEATQELGKIKSRKLGISEHKKEVLEHLFNALNKSNAKYDERQEKVLKSVFNKVLKVKTELDKQDEEGKVKAGFLTKKVEEFVLLLYALKYLQINDLDRALEQYGITVVCPKIETILPYLDGEGIRNTIQEFVNASVELTKSTNEMQENIEEGIYKELPANLRYDKQSNPAGINKTTFKKFSLLNLLKKMAPQKAKQKGEKLEQETDAKTRAGLFAINYILSLVSEK